MDLIELESLELTNIIGSLLQAVGEHSKLDTAKQLRLVSGWKTFHREVCAFQSCSILQICKLCKLTLSGFYIVGFYSSLAVSCIQSYAVMQVWSRFAPWTFYV